MFQSRFENAPLPAWIDDVESAQLLSVNDAAADHYGYSHKEKVRAFPDLLSCRQTGIMNCVITITVLFSG